MRFTPHRRRRPCGRGRLSVRSLNPPTAGSAAAASSTVGSGAPRTPARISVGCRDSDKSAERRSDPARREPVFLRQHGHHRPWTGALLTIRPPLGVRGARRRCRGDRRCDWTGRRHGPGDRAASALGDAGEWGADRSAFAARRPRTRLNRRRPAPVLLGRLLDRVPQPAKLLTRSDEDILRKFPVHEHVLVDVAPLVAIEPEPRQVLQPQVAIAVDRRVCEPRLQIGRGQRSSPSRSTAE